MDQRSADARSRKKLIVSAEKNEDVAETKHARGFGEGEFAAKAKASKRKRQSLSVIDYSGIFNSSSSARVELIRAGVSAEDVKRLQRELDMPQQVFLSSMKLSTATLNRKVGQRESFSPQDSERVVGVAKLIGQVQEMIEQSGDPDGFNAAKWLATWLQQPVPALGGARPIDYLDTMEGQGMVSDILARMQSGAYS
jgi:putative toxin-antitoxin system antitoxin component (TIGR02293 family)